jgi:hypothetical protein
MELINRDTAAHLNLMLIHDLIWEKEEDVKMPQIYVYYSWSDKENCEVAWVRYEREDGRSTSFKLNKKLTNTLVKSPIVCMDIRIRQELQAMELAKHEFPKGWLTANTPHPFDDCRQEDLWSLDRNAYEINVKVGKVVKEILTTSHRLLSLTTDRVYDLYMSLNVDSLDLTRFKLRFDRIYPKLPDLTNENDELAPIIIGIGEDFGLEPNDNTTYNQVVAELKRHEQNINSMIQKHLKKSRLKGEPLEMLKKEITSILMATSHYTGKVFGYDGVHGAELLNKVANETLDTLHKYRDGGKRDLRMDISSWFVWEYPVDGGQPLRAPEPELDFRTLIVEGYTDTFVDLLAPILMDSGHTDVISPYKFHVKADLSDGRAIGSMTRVTK